MKFRVLLFSFILFAGCTSKGVEKTNDESAVKDTLYFKMTGTYKNCGPCQGEEDLCSKLELSYPVFAGTKQGLVDTLNNYFTSFFNKTLGAPALSTIDEAWNASCKTFTQQMESQPMDMLSWFYEGAGSVMIMNKKFVSLAMLMYSFEGGAHPNAYEEMFSFDLETGKKMKLEDLFTDTEEIRKIAENKFRKEKNITPEQSYSDAGFDFEEFYISENFAFDEKDFIIYYNTYEIAAYMQGATELRIPYSEISRIMKPEILEVMKIEI
jgi:hypothetical protein